MTALPYHDDRDHLRRELLENSTAYFTPAGQKQINPNHNLRITSVLGSAYAYNLAAAIQWVAKNVGGTEADGLAAWLSDSLTNGDDDGLNEDLAVKPAVAPSTKPARTCRDDLIDLRIAADSIRLDRAGGCGACDMEPGWECVGCGKCNCDTHENCVRPDADGSVAL